MLCWVLIINKTLHSLSAYAAAGRLHCLLGGVGLEPLRAGLTPKVNSIFRKFHGKTSVSVPIGVKVTQARRGRERVHAFPTSYELRPSSNR